MRTKEGRPSREEVSAQQSTRTIYQASTPRVSAHRLTPSDAAVWAVFTIGVALILIGLCGLAWVIA